MVLNATTLRFYYGVRGVNQTLRDFTVSTLSPSTWYYLEWSRDGSGVMRVSVDGTLSSTTYTDTTDLNSGVLPWCIGGIRAGSLTEVVVGNLQDFFVLPGTELHSSNFTPPAAILQPISNNGSGVSAVLDEAGAPAAGRIVKAFQRGSGPGQVCWTTTDASGRYSLLAPDIEHNVIIEDDAAGTVYDDLFVGRVAAT